ncbi:MAG: helix-turn-helix domain-containing protein [Geodermatophilaceae bacterium]|nr:helix-turn-helix domain-containing protein [Geodermatophilaceae bacterium]
MRHRTLDLPNDPETARLGALARAARQRREQLGLRQRELADLAGVAFGTVQALERAHPGVGIGKILNVLGVLGLDLSIEVGTGGVRAGDL